MRALPPVSLQISYSWGIISVGSYYRKLLLASPESEEDHAMKYQKLARAGRLLLATVLLNVIAVSSTAPAFSEPGKSQAQCAQEVAKKHPPGTLSKNSGTREKLIAACVSGSTAGDVIIVKAPKQRQTDQQWLRTCTVVNKHSADDCHRWLACGRKGCG